MRQEESSNLSSRQAHSTLDWTSFFEIGWHSQCYWLVRSFIKKM